MKIKTEINLCIFPMPGLCKLMTNFECESCQKMSPKCGIETPATDLSMPTSRETGAFMKLGLGLYRHMLDDEHYRFARQCGCTHIVAHYVDYTNAVKGSANQPIGSTGGFGRTGSATL